MNPIDHRVSIRKYQERPVENEKILQILKAGMQAPSACNQQPWEFYVVTDKEKIGLLSQTTPYAGCAAGAPVVIIPVYRTESLPAPSMIPIDMGLSLENIWLETDALGLGLRRFHYICYRCDSAVCKNATKRNNERCLTTSSL